MVRRVQIVDSHTGGEPTRLVLAGGPDLGPSWASASESTPLNWQQVIGSLREQHDLFRREVLAEPRGGEHWVGALLLPATRSDCLCGVIYFNNVGYLGMCGHGTIGLLASLAYLGKIQPGSFRIETPVGVVAAQLHDQNRVTIENVPSYRWRSGVSLPLPGRDPVVGDLAWGGNWFFLTDDHRLELSMDRLPELTHFCLTIRAALQQAGMRGADGGEIDHIELSGPGSAGADSRNFVLCPGGAYDRSPCGTGTSAKLACLAAEGALQPGQIWVQESITGSRFEAEYQIVAPKEDERTEAYRDRAAQAFPTSADGQPLQIRPRITGQAYVSGEGWLIFDPADPFCHGIA